MISVLMMAVCAVLYQKTNHETVFSLMITFGTISYHFLMRLLIGFVIDLLLKNRVNYRARWFHVHPAEEKLYRKLKVKNWKGKMPTYDPKCFDRRIHSWDEIVQAMCQAELVHETIIVLSFVPIFAAIPFGSLCVFVITSVLAACFDAGFVIMQRYNRPRIIRLMERTEKKQTANCGR